jgi:FixJ family two-component response regulator
MVIILDDDPAIQALWQHKFAEFHVEMKLFSKYTEAVNWLNKLSTQKNLICIVDYELSGQPKNGLDFFEHLQIKSNAYLVTSHADELWIQNRIEKLGAWLIPKSLLHQIRLDE